MTGAANVLAFGYQFVMPRLLRPAEFAALTQLFGILLVEAIGAQVIQTATAKLAAQYRARDDAPALHVFVRRWVARLAIGAAVPAALIVAASPWLGAALELSTLSVAVLGITILVAVVSTFALGLLQGLGRFIALGSNLILQAGLRLGLGVALVLLGFGVDGAFLAATLAIIIGTAVAFYAVRGLFTPARGTEPHLAPSEGRFYALAGVVILAYAGLTNIDAVLSRVLLSAEEAGSYAAAVTLGKVILFAPLAVGFILLERTARAHEQGRATERVLYAALAFVLATSGTVALGYVIAPDFFTRIVVGDQYGGAPALVPVYGLAALANALLSIWNAYFIGRGELRVGALLAAALVVETVALLLFAHDAATMVRIVAAVAVTTQTAVGLWFLATRSRGGGGREPKQRAHQGR